MKKQRKLKLSILYSQNTIMFVISIIVGALILGVSIINFTVDTGSCENGCYTFNNDKGGLQQLNGEWVFVHDQFLDYTEIMTYNSYQEVPGMWNSYALSNGETMGANGYGTFGIKVRNVEKGQRYVLRIPSVGTACTFYINDMKVGENGVVARNKEDYKGLIDVKYVEFIAPASEFVIVAHVANYDYARSGLWLPVELMAGEEYVGIMISRNTFFVGVMSVLIIVFFVAAFLAIAGLERKKSVELLILIVLIVLYNMTKNEKLVMDLIPNLSVRWFAFLQYLVISVAPPLYLRLTISFSKKKTVQKASKLFMIHGIILALFCLVMPVAIFTQFTVYFYGVIFIQEALMMYVVVKGAIDGERGALGFVFAGVITILCVTHDMLSGAALIASHSEIVIVGFVLMIVAIGLNILFYIEQGRQEVVNSKLYRQAYLNATIKPHFLFNTLTMIIGIIETDKEKAKEVVYSLSDLLRHVVGEDSLSETVMLEKELHVAEEYANIQMTRFNQLTIYFDFEKIESVRVPFFILQPLIENSIKHGISVRSGKGNIWVKGHWEETCYQISVIDDGVGISKERLSNINRSLASSNGDVTGDSIGLYNVNERLLALYNKKLMLYSKPGEGTSVIIEVPRG